VIVDVTKKMGHGMADFAEKQSINTVDEYNLYCYYVAGLVGFGLCQLFSASGCEDKSVADAHNQANAMGLFLQKVNIIRDYLDDLHGKRTWWPKEIWQVYAESLQSLKDRPNSRESLACLNHMITDALELVPDCLDFISKLKNPQVFRFCAVPQLMSLATFAVIYNNPDVYRRNVKMRKGITCRLMVEVNDFKSCLSWYYQFATEMLEKIPSDDPNGRRTEALLHRIITMTGVKPNPLSAVSRTIGYFLVFLTIALLVVRFVQPLAIKSYHQVRSSRRIHLYLLPHLAFWP
jgi:farnesyl-diphosphate farnesyltransferase